MPIEIEKAKNLWPPTCHGRWMSEEYEPGLVSVIVPTYNRAHLIEDTLDSVWAQPYRPIELIVVDDGSNDDMGQVREKLAPLFEEGSRKRMSRISTMFRFQARVF